MDTGFDPHLHQVRTAFKRLRDATAVGVNSKPSPIPKEPGVYVFYRDGEPLRVGTAQDLRERVKQHYGNNHKSAAFAKQLARKKTGIRGSYETGWEEQVEMHPELEKAFEAAREEIRKMSVRCVVESDADCRYLLEFYAAKELRTPHNDFSET